MMYMIMTMQMISLMSGKTNLKTGTMPGTIMKNTTNKCRQGGDQIRIDLFYSFMIEVEERQSGIFRKESVMPLYHTVDFFYNCEYNI